MSKLNLIDRGFTATEINELPDGKMIVKGPIMEVGVRLQNGTEYDASLWDGIIKEYKPFMLKEMAYGMLDHPLRDYKDLSTKFERVYGRATNLEFSDDKKFIIATFLIYDNAVGKELQYFLKNGTVGISTRGVGKTKPHNGGKKVIRYHLVGIDFVASPSSIKALVTAKTNADNFEVLIEGTDYVNENRVNYMMEIDDVSSIDISSYMIESKEDSNICSLESGNCSMSNLMETLKVDSHEEEEILFSGSTVEVNSPDGLLENVADLLAPSKSVSLDNFDADIKRLSTEDIIENYKKLILEKEANSYLNQPNGEFLKKVFIALTQSGVEISVAKDVLLLFTGKLAEFTSKDEEKVKALEAKIELKNKEIEAIKSDANNRMKGIESDVQAKLQETIRLKDEEIASLKAQHEEVLKNAEAKHQEVLSDAKNKHKESLEVVKKESEVNMNSQLEKLRGLQQKAQEEVGEAISASKEEIAQYYTLLEEKDALIKEYKDKLDELSGNHENLLDDFTALTEGFNQIKNVSETLLEEKIDSSGEVERLTNEVIKYAENHRMLQESVKLLVEERDSLAIEREKLTTEVEKLVENAHAIEARYVRQVEGMVSEKKNSLLELQRNAKLLKEYSTLVQKVEISNKELMEERNLLLSKMDETVNLVEEKESELLEVHEQVKILEEEKSEMHSEVEKLSIRAKDYEEKLEDAKENATSVLLENELLVDELEDAKIQNSKYEEEMSEVRSRNVELEEANEEFMRKIQELEEKLKGLGRNINSEKEEIDSATILENKNNDLNKKMNKKRNELVGNAESRLSSLYESLEGGKMSEHGNKVSKPSSSTSPFDKVFNRYGKKKK